MYVDLLLKRNNYICGSKLIMKMIALKIRKLNMSVQIVIK